MLPLLHPDSEADALIEAETGTVWSHRELAQRAQAVADRLAGPRALVSCRTALTLDAVAGYLGALLAGHAVVVVDAASPPALERVVDEVYRPRFTLTPDGSVEEDGSAPEIELDPSLSVLLSTSGTTGSPKLVRLSASAVRANAASIVEYLGLTADERALASLPIHYSYGLSVLNSHLLAGGSLVLPGATLLQPAFWDAAERHGATSFAGVPYAYSLLGASDFARRPLPALRTMTQAGGRLGPEAVLRYAAKMRERGGRFIPMYGQTEATARMAWLPPDHVEERPDSIGIPIPGGRLEVDEATQELVYSGPNVMLGYATSRAELALGDEQRGVLRTGDLGRRDDQGFHYVTGRLHRFAKLLGLRVSLDDIERALPGEGAALERDERAIRIFVTDPAEPPQVRTSLSERFGLPPRSFDVRAIDALPRTPSGKVDYAALREAT